MREGGSGAKGVGYRGRSVFFIPFLLKGVNSLLLTSLQEVAERKHNENHVSAATAVPLFRDPLFRVPDPTHPPTLPPALPPA